MGMIKKMKKLKMPKSYELWVNSIPKKSKIVRQFLGYSCPGEKIESIYLNYLNDEEINIKYYQREFLLLGKYSGYAFSMRRIKLSQDVFAKILFSVQKAVKLELT
mmetsp:Transcript_16929/g.18900  ORF Transcript_16929/g.18900 Transcript_16929/m.18900 type:complete len:105 (+) Transcript_16929:271-585(+)